MQTTSADELVENIAVGATLTISAAYFDAPITVTNATPRADGPWLFEAIEDDESEQRWRFKVLPKRGIVEAYWFTEDGACLAGGHHDIPLHDISF